MCSVVILICFNILRSTKKIEPMQRLAHITKLRTSLKSEAYEQVQVVRNYRIWTYNRLIRWLAKFLSASLDISDIYINTQARGIGTVHVNKFIVRWNACSGVLLWCGGSVSSSSTVIAQTLQKNCVGESPRVSVKWYPALVASLIGLRYVTH